MRRVGAAAQFVHSCDKELLVPLVPLVHGICSCVIPGNPTGEQGVQCTVL
jgi:hypothetical protein